MYDINILDLVGYIVILFLIGKFFDTDSIDLSGCIGVIIMIIYTIVWFYIFVWLDYDLIDIFYGANKSIKFSL